MSHRVGNNTYLGVKLGGGVYLVNSAGSDLYKVGYSKDIARRIGDLTTAHHAKLVLAAWIPDAPPDLEREIHNKLAPYRAEGEWFALNPLQLALLVNERSFVPTDAFSYLDEANCPADSVMMRALRMRLLGLDSGVIQGVLISESLVHTAKAIRAIAHGDVDGPGGIEGLAMAIAGEGLGDSLARAIRERASE